MLSEENEYLLKRAYKDGWFTNFELKEPIYTEMGGTKFDNIVGIPVRLFRNGLVILSAFYKEKAQLVDLCGQTISFDDIKRIITPYPVAEVHKHAINVTVQNMIAFSKVDSTYLTGYSNIYAKLFEFNDEEIETKGEKIRLSDRLTKLTNKKS